MTTSAMNKYERRIPRLSFRAKSRNLLFLITRDVSTAFDNNENAHAGQADSPSTTVHSGGAVAGDDQQLLANASIKRPECSGNATCDQQQGDAPHNFRLKPAEFLWSQHSDALSRLRAKREWKPDMHRDWVTIFARGSELPFLDG